MPVFEIPCESVNLFPLEQATPVSLAHVGIGHEVEGIFGPNHTAQLSVGAVEMVFPGKSIESSECRGGRGMTTLQ